MKNIVCTGDSRTWGQEENGITEGVDSELIWGDVRITNLYSKSDVN